MVILCSHCTSVLFWFTDGKLDNRLAACEQGDENREKLFKADINTKGGINLQLEKINNLVITKVIDKKQIQKIQMAPSVEAALGDPVSFHAEICHSDHSWLDYGWSCDINATKSQLSSELQDDLVWKDLPETKKGPIRFLT